MTQDYFAWFGLAPAFEIDTADLSARYREVLGREHPDRYAQAPAAERRASAERSAEVNSAYRTLKDPVARARYLLEVAGVDTGEETDTVMDSRFLVQQMDFRERLEAAREAGGEESRRRFSVLAREIEWETESKLAALTEAFRQQKFNHARSAVRELQFLRRLSESLDSVEQED